MWCGMWCSKLSAVFRMLWIGCSTYHLLLMVRRRPSNVGHILRHRQLYFHEISKHLLVFRLFPEIHRLIIISGKIADHKWQSNFAYRGIHNNSNGIFINLGIWIWGNFWGFSNSHNFIERFDCNIWWVDFCQIKFFLAIFKWSINHSFDFRNLFDNSLNIILSAIFT